MYNQTKLKPLFQYSRHLKNENPLHNFTCKSRNNRILQSVAQNESIMVQNSKPQHACTGVVASEKIYNNVTTSGRILIEKKTYIEHRQKPYIYWRVKPTCKYIFYALIETLFFDANLPFHINDLHDN